MVQAAESVASMGASTKPDNASAAPAPTPNSHTESSEALSRRVEGIVRRNVYWSLGIGIVPLPIVDLVGVTAIELKMIKELADAYQVKFTENTAKSIIASLAVSVGSLGLAGAVASSLFKLIPAVGTVVGVIGVSVFAGAFTQALGNVFIMHFETGGTLLTFNADKMRTYFRQEFEKAKVSVAQLQKDEQAKAKPAA